MMHPRLCGAEVQTFGGKDGDAVHYCTRYEGHTGQHLCPCRYHWSA